MIKIIYQIINHNIEKKNDDYRKYYNDELKKIVYEKHKKEFEMLGYDF